MKRFHIPNMGPDTANIPKAFALGVKLCEESGVNELTLVIPSKGNLSGIVVGEFVGEAASKRLTAGETVPLRGSVYLRCESPKTLKNRSEPDIVLAFYISSDDLNVIDSLRGTQAAIFVPWLDTDGVAWQRTWNAEVPGQPTVETAPALDPTVEAGLRNLTSHINLSTGLSHPSDMRDAKKLFSDLRASRVAYDPADIRVWAVRNGWRPDDADELMQLATRYLK